jgi:hypothetical protein
MPRRPRWLLLLALVLAGCGRHGPPPREHPITLHELDSLRDTTGLSRGAAILERMEPYRMSNGAIRVRGVLDLPPGTVVQIAVTRAGDRWPIARTQFALAGPRFDSPPMLGPRGTLPAGTYRFELLSMFDPEWQPAEVLRATQDGRALRGPGITRDLQGRAAFSHTEEHRL